MEDTGQGPPQNLPEVPPPSEVEVEDHEDDDGFSFPAPPLPADACIVPVYPIFGRPPSPPPAAPGEAPAGEHEPATATVRVPLGRLLLEEREFRARQQDVGGRSESARAWREQDDEDDDDDGDGGASAAADEELEGVPPESYCLWAPGGQASAPASPRRCRKSGSTGSVLRWRRISDRLVGRSHSDGKEKFVFLTAAAADPEPTPPPPPGTKEEEEGGGGSNRVRDGGGGAAHQLRYHGRGGGGGGSRRRSYLPYRQELVGLFANVSGLRRSYHPF
ncbi:hypothetical protein SETIT_5G253200v2 [Setaria italica]|uniref:DUF1645 domain-containing protein n=1 Tax=Setaria italica TaxID=4555 RepID=A0A368R8L8_SETIT|nr:uncharacterized protein LOC101781771 [Setaria italica]RCV26531.1 hypothetical protein SETIT_5G253200v2 [Setaria italica]